MISFPGGVDLHPHGKRTLKSLKNSDTINSEFILRDDVLQKSNN